MACGTPVVCSNRSSLPEVAGDAALLVEPDRTEALAGALARIVSEEDLRGRLVARGFQRVQIFSWTKAAQATLQVLEEVGREVA
jgi:glycosyltransferase involved in cell wall biosynthesis